MLSQVRLTKCPCYCRAAIAAVTPSLCVDILICRLHADHDTLHLLNSKSLILCCQSSTNVKP